ncbi:MAG: hypothetical protein A3H93_16185 [Rhodocyclales bacterium RIFCSPLOWO2_02_FULL_63_24]|nr:MAG: hypothetical protein A3H93_16185 [Rhodocyclales bacterium RIFCSPLOWO2_02_FULL_63_24]
MNRELLKRTHWQLRRTPLPVALATLLGLVLLAGAVIGERRVLAPLAATVTDIRHETQTLRSQAARRHQAEAGSDPAAQLGEFYGFFPAEASVPETLERIYAAAAQQNLMLEHGDYRLAPDTEARLQRYDVVLPVKGRYGAIRRFVAQVLEDNPNLALTAISFSRQTASDIGVDAQLQLTIFLAAE